MGILLPVIDRVKPFRMGRGWEGRRAALEGRREEGKPFNGTDPAQLFLRTRDAITAFE
jgi:hypothetical protein